MGALSGLYKFIVIGTAIALVILTIPYWIFLKTSVDNSDWLWVILDILSAVFMIILAIIGIIGALKGGKFLLMIYAIGMFCLALFILIQMIIFLINYHQCSDTVLYIFECNFNLGGYLAPTIIMLVVCIVGGVAAVMLFKQLKSDAQPAGSYY